MPGSLAYGDLLFSMLEFEDDLKSLKSGEIELLLELCGNVK
jgi:hypothetical protein|tara:strand:+ start:973 stop:1095 length:123 start_codon:yes stop_codon:yes gene_type:complete